MRGEPVLLKDINKTNTKTTRPSESLLCIYCESETQARYIQEGNSVCKEHRV